MTETEPTYILGAEFFGIAKTVDGILDIGGLKVPLHWWNDDEVSVYVRRVSDDLSIMEVHLARHDGLSDEELQRQNGEADRYPLGPKEYWRGVSVGKDRIAGEDGVERFMTDQDFEEHWAEGNPDD